MLPLYRRFDQATQQMTCLVRDSETGRPLIISKQKTDVIIDANKRLAALFDPHLARRSHWRQVAAIPNVVYWDWHKKGITRDRKRLMKTLSRRDTRFFRVDDGRPLI